MINRVDDGFIERRVNGRPQYRHDFLVSWSGKTDKITRHKVKVDLNFLLCTYSIYVRTYITQYLSRDTGSYESIALTKQHEFFTHSPL